MLWSISLWCSKRASEEPWITLNSPLVQLICKSLDFWRLKNLYLADSVATSALQPTCPSHLNIFQWVSQCQRPGRRIEIQSDLFPFSPYAKGSFISEGESGQIFTQGFVLGSHSHPHAPLSFSFFNLKYHHVPLCSILWSCNLCNAFEIKLKKI